MRPRATEGIWASLSASLVLSFRSGQQGILDLTRLLQDQLGLIALKSELRSEMNRLRKGHPGADPEKLTLLQRVLSEAFIFGDDPNAQKYLWDLVSYDESDSKL